MPIRWKMYEMMVKRVVNTGRRNHAYASLWAGVKKFFTAVRGEDAVLRVGVQLDATHSPFLLLAMMSMLRGSEGAGLAA